MYLLTKEKANGSAIVILSGAAAIPPSPSNTRGANNIGKMAGMDHGVSRHFILKYQLARE